jgi:nucleoside-diphosphate-sugar epimerase
MKILIAGGSGSLGYDLALLLSKNHKVISSYRTANKKFNNNESLVWKKIDFKNKINLNFSPDIIINCLATHKFSKKKKLKDYLDSHVLAVKNLHDIAIKKKTNFIINLSTVSVYSDNNKKILINEKDLIDFNNILSITKYFGEKILEQGSVRYLNLRLPAILTSNINNRRTWISNLIYNIKFSKKIKLFNAEKKFNALIDSFEIYSFIEHVIKKNISGTCNFVPFKSEKLLNIALFIKKYFNSNSKIFTYRNNKKSFIYKTDKIQQKISYKTSKVICILKRYLDRYY